MGAESSTLASPLRNDENGEDQSVKLRINGIEYKVGSDVPPYTTLADFIRQRAHLTGTKLSCREGGCGACMVTARVPNIHTMTNRVCAVNSCLRPVLGCDGWEVTTVEGLGNKKNGFHRIQTRLAQYNGTQCGFCSPGMVMLMNSVSEQDEGFSQQEAEFTLGGNLCRCTGYRPILDAFKSLTHTTDIEDLSSLRCCGGQSPPSPFLPINFKTTFAKIVKSGENETTWLHPTNLEELMKIIDHLKDTPYRIIASNTGSGVYKDFDSALLTTVQVSAVAELLLQTTGPTSVHIGSATSLTESIRILTQATHMYREAYEYLTEIIAHMEKIASHSIRNVGTIGGNLMMKQTRNEFYSDLFVALAAIEATVIVASVGTVPREMSIIDFMKENMANKILVAIKFPPKQTPPIVVKCYKVPHRWQFSVAYVNAAFVAHVDTRQNYKIIGRPSLVFGGINPQFIHASNTEDFLMGKSLNDEANLQRALKILFAEVNPSTNPGDSDPRFRRNLSCALFYKYVLHILRDEVPSRLQSGADVLVRRLVSGQQSFDTDQKLWPLTQPVIKLEAMSQCSGEAEYIADIPERPHELHAAFVLSTVGNATIKNVDAQEALKLPGVVGFYSAKDIPGVNSAATPDMYVEEVFCSGKVKYAGQAIGIVVANDRWQAERAASKVKVEYEDVQKPILTIQDAIRGGSDTFQLDVTKEKLADESRRAASKHIVKGEFEIGSQYHFSMETQTCICVPKEDGTMDVQSATQWLDSVQNAVAQVLGMPFNSINLQVRRLGGAYGAKISRPVLVASACAVAAHHTNRPVRMVMDLESNMKMIGKRLPYYCKYEAGTDDRGRMDYLQGIVICDTGINYNETTSYFAVQTARNCYDAPAQFQLMPGRVLTNTASNTYCRAPGSVQGIGIIETIMEHVSHATGQDPVSVRLANMGNGVDPPTNPVIGVINQLKDSAHWDVRQIDANRFNAANRWRKKGLSLVPMSWPVRYGVRYSVIVSIFQGDGTVVVAHGGIECGQGINTKVAQVVAYTLNIPLDMVRIRPTNNLTNPNGSTTGGTYTSELNAYAAKRCCEDLLERMKPVKDRMKNPTWPQLVKACYTSNVSLCAHHMYSPSDPVQGYNVLGAAAAEVELDVLTGQYIINRVDIIEDAGLSMSPDVDIGQVEGAFIMGIGMWTTEKLNYDPSTGVLLTNGTWSYKIPTCKDIPEDIRITLLKNAPNPAGVLQSKSTGEPPQCMAVCVHIAIRNAIQAARKDAGNREPWFQMDSPATTEDIFQLGLAGIEQFVLK